MPENKKNNCQYYRIPTDLIVYSSIMAEFLMNIEHFLEIIKNIKLYLRENE